MVASILSILFIVKFFPRRPLIICYWLLANKPMVIFWNDFIFIFILNRLNISYITKNVKNRSIIMDEEKNEEPSKFMLKAKNANPHGFR